MKYSTECIELLALVLKLPCDCFNLSFSVKAWYFFSLGTDLLSLTFRNPSISANIPYVCPIRIIAIVFLLVLLHFAVLPLHYKCDTIQVLGEQAVKK